MFGHFDSLAIIGNGFDLNHGLKTDFESFKNKTDDESLRIFKGYCDTEKIETWYDFENSVSVLSSKLFLDSMMENCDYEEKQQEILEFNRIFTNIQQLFKDYLLKETDSISIDKKDIIKKHLEKSTFAINFNYTDTVELYIRNVFYVHGSLKENDIVLGYDFREEPCLATFDDIKWSKQICRESLAFRRYFIKKKNSKKYQELLSGLETYQHWENSGRGLDYDAKSFIPKYRKINRFIRKYRKSLIIPSINYKRIKKVIFIGHSIFADLEYIKMILCKCINLKEIVIYRYAGETEEAFNKKISFLKTYCDNVEIEDY